MALASSLSLNYALRRGNVAVRQGVTHFTPQNMETNGTIIPGYPSIEMTVGKRCNGAPFLKKQELNIYGRFRLKGTTKRAEYKASQLNNTTE
jgi:hypothetical protein